MDDRASQAGSGHSSLLLLRQKSAGPAAPCIAPAPRTGTTYYG
jgi:hypothetical protein